PGRDERRAAVCPAGRTGPIVLRPPRGHTAAPSRRPSAWVWAERPCGGARRAQTAETGVLPASAATDRAPCAAIGPTPLGSRRSQRATPHPWAPLSASRPA